MQEIEEDEDLMFILISIVWVQMIVSYLLLKCYRMVDVTRQTRDLIWEYMDFIFKVQTHESRIKNFSK